MLNSEQLRRGDYLDVLKIIKDYALRFPKRVAVKTGSKELTYGQLWEYSDHLAAWLLENGGQEKSPVAVYGHKDPLMLVCFLACVKSGRAYCPIDISVPDVRVELILRALPSRLVLATEPLSADAGTKRIVNIKEPVNIKGPVNIEGADMAGESEQRGLKRQPLENDWVSGDDTYYIIFTSGSTGTPKGVQITADCLNHYLEWSVGLGNTRQEKQGQVFLNQAPFSFDLSVMDLYTSLASGGTLYCLEKSVQSDYRALMQSLRESGASVWVSTPSFAEVCLSERAFSETMLPQMKVFLFCGETLGNRTAKKLQERFPNAKIVNTYGPTESTVAVTDVLVTRELEAQENPLPVGLAKIGTRIEIHDPDGGILPEGEKGEIIIIGNTVSTGYYARADLTEKAFFHDAQSGMRGYRTGDKGYLKDGMLYYCGRIDLQIKLHGYRIELEDIENNIRKLPQVEHVVVVPNSRGGKVSSLTAYIVKKPEEGNKPGAVLQEKTDEREAAAKIREKLRQFLPDYMIPKKIVFLDQMPMTNNGKADRKLLGGKNG